MGADAVFGEGLQVKGKEMVCERFGYYMIKKHKLLGILLCLMLAVTMTGGCASNTQNPEMNKDSAGNKAKDSGKEGKAKYKEFITVDVFDSQSNYQGIQSGWFAKIIKDKFNMELNIIAPNVAGGGETLLQTRSAAGNLGDLILTSAAGGKLQDLVTAGLIIDMTEFMEGKKNLSKYQAAIEYTNKTLAKEEGIWAIPSEISERPADTNLGGTVLNFGTYIRWDLYKQLGYPKMKTLEDLLPVMKEMQDIAGVSDSGKKIYAFSLFKDWDSEYLGAANQIPYMYGYAPIGYAYAKADDSEEPQSALAEDSLYIRGLKFFFQANQMGLLDPESTTQNFDALSKKYKDGAVLWSPWPWQSSGYNTADHTSSGKAFNTAAVEDFQLYDWGCYTKGNPYNSIMIGSKAKDPQRLMDFIDWLYSPEGLTVAYSGSLSGIKGLMWDVEGGKPVLTDFGYKCLTNGDKTLMPEEYGGGTYLDGIERLNFKAVSDGEINPETGYPYNYLMWDDYLSLTLTDMERDWQTHMKAKNAAEYFYKNKQAVISVGSGYAVSAEDPDITTIRAQIRSTIVEYSWKSVFAKDEGEFTRLIQEMTDIAMGLGYEKVLNIDLQNAEQQKQARAAIDK